MTNLRKIVRKVLAQLGNNQEARHYLHEYSNEDSLQFAVIKVGGGILRDELDALANALSTIRHLGLFPVVIHGAGPQLDAAIKAVNLVTEKKDGMRVTTPEVMEVARPVIYKANRSLVHKLIQLDVESIGIQHGVFECSFLNKEHYGLVGQVEKVHLDSIRAATSQGALPIISCFGETKSGQVVNINADVAARELVWALQPRKVIFLTATGGLLNEKREIISSLSLLTDYSKLMRSDWVHSGMRLKLQQIKELLQPLPTSASVSITSVQNILRELFTHRGAGTLINQGEEILELDEMNVQQEYSLQKLIEKSFGRSLTENYFTQTKFKKIFMTASGDAAAVIIEGLDGVPYLDKFTVAPEAQGFGHAAVLWRLVKENFSSLYWRSRVKNPISNWYFQKAECAYRQDEWYGFSYGISDLQLNHACLHDALQRKVTWQQAA